MAITKKVKHSRNLESYRVWVEDRTHNSRYFQVRQLPEVFTAGKSAFLINGSDELITGTEVLVELKDVNGSVVFSQPIKNYAEGLARVVTVEVYEDTPEGLGTLTILGHIARDENGIAPPDEFTKAYNVRWQAKVPIAPRMGNISTVRLHAHPTASVTELLTTYREVARTAVTTTGSLGTSITGTSLYGYLRDENVYVLQTNQPFFTKEMEGGEINIRLGDTTSSSSVVEVLNDTTIRVEPAFLNPDDSYLRFTSTDFTMSYSGSMTYVQTEHTRSFADISITNLNTFSGDVYRVKVFLIEEDNQTDPEFLADVRVSSPEMMMTKSLVDGETKINTGIIQDLDVVSVYWTGSDITSASVYNPQ